MKILPAAVSESLFYGRGIVNLRNFPKVLILFNTFCFIHGRGVIGWQYELSGSSQPKIIWQWLEIFFWFKNCQAGFEILMTAGWRGGSIVGWRLYFANNLTNISTDKYYGEPTWLTPVSTNLHHSHPYFIWSDYEVYLRGIWGSYEVNFHIFFQKMK